MFLTIYTHELRQWFRKPSFYIYLLLMVLIATFASAGSVGFFEDISVSMGGIKTANSPLAILKLFKKSTMLLLFLLPSIIGVTIQRDYKSKMDALLYSYPFSKAQYLLGKFLSGYTIVILIIVAMAFGTMLGFRLPGTNAALLGQFRFDAYWYTFITYLLPTMFLHGIIVFAVVAFTRNITAGFVSIIMLILLQGSLNQLSAEVDNRYIAGLLSPSGGTALKYYTRYWTVAEQNTLALPYGALIIYNRLLWVGIAGLIGFVVYLKFTFSSTPPSFNFFKKKQGKRVTKHNFGGITRIHLPKVNHDYSFLTHLKTTCKLSNIDFKYILTAPPFIILVLFGIVIMIVGFSQNGKVQGADVFPLTSRMLVMGYGLFSLSTSIITFLYAGMLVNRAKASMANFLIDVTPTPNWVLWISQLIALFKVQLVLLTAIMLTGIGFQLFKGYIGIELGHYMFELYVLRFLDLMVIAIFALFIQTLIRNPYLGLFLLLAIIIGMEFLDIIGIEQTIFKFNGDSGFRYSDLNKYGAGLSLYFVYRLYWIFFGLVLLALTHLFWVRGLPTNFKERLSIFRERCGIKTKAFIAVSLLLFVGLGARIYYENNFKNRYVSAKERERGMVDIEKKYKKYEGKAQPRIVAVSVKLDLYPKTNDFEAEGTYKMVNKSGEAIDSIFLNHNAYPSTFKFGKSVTLVLEDTISHFDIYKLKKPLLPNEKLELSFTVKNKPNSIFRINSSVKHNGTFLSNFDLFPSLGYRAQELEDNIVRKKYGLPKNDLKPHPSDTTNLADTYISKDSDWIDFEAFVSTDEDQIAIAPGYLQKEWIKDGRKHYHYKMDSKILHFYSFNSGKYQVKKDKWKDINLEIYYHKGHEYNLEQMMEGLKASLAYNSKYFSPYQHKQVRIIEFPSTIGSFAQSFANTIPFSEGVGFVADVDRKKANGYDFAFAITVHELAHQWWAHQVIGADVLGATMLSESLAEYVSLKVLEQQQGKKEMRKFLKKSLDGYLSARAFESKRENALMYNDGQGYIRYQKGSLIFYALSDYIGEQTLNDALKKYINKVKFQTAPYTTSIEMVDEIRKVVPDSLQYIIKDMFETVTLYDNKVVTTKSRKMKNGKYKVDIEFNVRKYRNDEKGKAVFGKKPLSYKAPKDDVVKSVPLADYIDIGIFATPKEGETSKALYLKKHKVSKINNKISIIVDEEPFEVGVDPYNKLIDTDSDDNRKGF